jgi:cyclopropane-fatty-acyl-phospholipid synthase
MSFRIQNHRHRRTGAAAGLDHPRRDPAAVLAHRDPARQRHAESDACSPDEMAARAMPSTTRQAMPASRSAGGILRPGARSEAANISCCFYKEPEPTLQEAEEEALRQTVEHADLADGQSILELGCGWGSLSLWMARQFPKSQVTAVSNSHSQREYIERRRRRAD